LSSACTAKIILRPIDPGDVPQALAKTRPAYAAKRAKADHISLVEATEFVARQLTQALPQGGATPSAASAANASV
jgi:hypothetical protein